jgi:hypothetical protein
MARTSQSTEKRKRNLESPSSGYDGDTIVVLPHQAAAVQGTKTCRPLRDLQTEANVTRRRTASRVKSMYNAALLRSHDRLANCLPKIPRHPRPHRYLQAPKHNLRQLTTFLQIVVTSAAGVVVMPTNNVCLLAGMIRDVLDASETRRTGVGQRRLKR